MVFLAEDGGLLSLGFLVIVLLGLGSLIHKLHW